MKGAPQKSPLLYERTRMATDKVKKIQAFKRLMEISRKGSIELYGTTEADIYSDARRWPVHWDKDLGNGRFKNEQDRQRALDDNLACLVTVDSPSSLEQLKKEKKLARLILDAGADANRYYRFHNRNIFDDFLLQEKPHIALEIAKTDEFMGPGRPFKIFDHLMDKLEFYLRWKELFQEGDDNGDKKKSALYAQNYEDQKEVVYLLFQKGIYPPDVHVFERLSSVVLERDPDFFNKKKEQVILQMQRAETPLQIYNALMGNRKEKN